MPCCRIDSISSSSTSRAKSFRGCNVLGTMLVSSIWCTLSAAPDPSLGVATVGVPISAPRPLPRPDRAIGPEATGTALRTQTAIRTAAMFGWLDGGALRSPARCIRRCSINGLAVARPFISGCAPATKRIKKRIDTKGCNPVSTRPAPKEFLPGRFFVCEDPSEQQKQT
jgi:hypothetical protein